MGERQRPWEVLDGSIHRHFLLLLLVAYTVAAIWPRLGVAVRDLTLAQVVLFHEAVPLTLPMLFLAILLCHAGLSTEAAELAQVVQRPQVLFAGLAVNVLLPLGFT